MSRLVLVASIVVPLVVTGGVTAAPIDLVSFRSVDIRQGSTTIAHVESVAVGTFLAHPFGPLPGVDTVTVGASQSTMIDGVAGSVGGTGTVTVGYSALRSLDIRSRSLLDVTFDLAAPHSYVLAGMLTATDDGGRAIARWSLLGATSLAFEATAQVPPVLLSHAGMLDAGSYRLVVEAVMDNGGDAQEEAVMGGSSGFDFTFQLTDRGQSVPEPGVLPVMLAGLVSLVGRYWRARPA